ncbi:hypothetical protein EJ02DRAFT_450117 [Clathrospora elynae]|uniref:Uncharacterized protein n=1 Tax=Clathrospora elynae TaxID=706981 RepID=A0A6A5T3H0_9PLEO|nr:hypothetical protein EJ02DRAFT_450117 [Clathrospora elynae]
MLHPEASRWPDTEFSLHGQEDRSCFGGSPKPLEDACRKLHLGRGFPIANQASDRRSHHRTVEINQIRRVEDPSELGALFIFRVSSEFERTATAHRWMLELTDLLCKPHTCQ